MVMINTEEEKPMCAQEKVCVFTILAIIALFFRAFTIAPNLQHTTLLRPHTNARTTKDWPSRSVDYVIWLGHHDGCIRDGAKMSHTLVQNAKENFYRLSKLRKLQVGRMFVLLQPQRIPCTHHRIAPIRTHTHTHHHHSLCTVLWGHSSAAKETGASHHPRV